jgi:shikimate kinase
MKMNARQFRSWKSKSITLVGMSGVGKTHLSTHLRRQNWFHYSADYRIGTRYLGEPILDQIKSQAMQVPFLRDFLRSDSIYIASNITVDNLKPVLGFLGKLGNPARGGLELSVFKERQVMYHDAEVAAMKDVPEFIRKAHEIYGYPHFVNDAAGSLCELEDPEVLEILAEHTLILYIQATEKNGRELRRRAKEDPKPLLYREEFLDAELAVFMKEKRIRKVAQIVPDDFVRWIFPRLFASRIPRYEAIARDHGYTISSDALSDVTSEGEFLARVERILD